MILTIHDRAAAVLLNFYSAARTHLCCPFNDTINFHLLSIIQEVLPLKFIRIVVDVNTLPPFMPRRTVVDACPEMTRDADHRTVPSTIVNLTRVTTRIQTPLKMIVLLLLAS
jgi:hypothetical protein